MGSRDNRHRSVDLAFILNETGALRRQILSKECHDWTLRFNRIVPAAGLKRNLGVRVDAGRLLYCER